MEQFKRAKVVLLPTKQKSNIYKNDKSNLISTRKYLDSPLHNSITNYHLYIISDDEIKEGDWVTDSIEVIQSSSKLVNSQTLVNRREWKKIIATTDTSLKIESKLWKTTSNLPQPSQQFIEKYIEEYNKGCIIKDVLVEYEGIISSTTWEHDEPEEWRLKINPKDNTITIKKVKDSWNRNEVITILNKLNNTLNIGSDLTLEEWIERNL